MSLNLVDRYLTYADTDFGIAGCFGIDDGAIGIVNISELLQETDVHSPRMKIDSKCMRFVQLVRSLLSILLGEKCACSGHIDSCSHRLQLNNPKGIELLQQVRCVRVGENVEMLFKGHSVVSINTVTYDVLVPKNEIFEKLVNDIFEAQNPCQKFESLEGLVTYTKKKIVGPLIKDRVFAAVREISSKKMEDAAERLCHFLNLYPNELSEIGNAYSYVICNNGLHSKGAEFLERVKSLEGDKAEKELISMYKCMSELAFLKEDHSMLRCKTLPNNAELLRYTNAFFKIFEAKTLTLKIEKV